MRLEWSAQPRRSYDARGQVRREVNQYSFTALSQLKYLVSDSRQNRDVFSHLEGINFRPHPLSGGYVVRLILAFDARYYSIVSWFLIKARRLSKSPVTSGGRALSSQQTEVPLLSQISSTRRDADYDCRS